jgi:hypothetical protein
MDWDQMPSEDQVYNAVCLLSFVLLFIGMFMGMMGAVLAIMFGPYVIKAQEAINIHLGIGLFGTIYGVVALIAAVLWKAFHITHPVFALVLCIIFMLPTFIAGPRVLSTVGAQQASACFEFTRRSHRQF